MRICMRVGFRFSSAGWLHFGSSPDLQSAGLLASCPLSALISRSCHVSSRGGAALEFETWHLQIPLQSTMVMAITVIIAPSLYGAHRHTHAHIHTKTGTGTQAQAHRHTGIRRTQARRFLLRSVRCVHSTIKAESCWLLFEGPAPSSLTVVSYYLRKMLFVF